MKAMDRRRRDIKKLNELHDRGRLPRHMGLPPCIDNRIERAESQSMSVLDRRKKDGLLQLLVKRRKKIREEPGLTPKGEVIMKKDAKNAEREARMAKRHGDRQRRPYM